MLDQAVDTVLKDLAHACRALGRSRLLSLCAVLSLALGIGANCTIFTFVHALFVDPLPAVEEAGRLFSLYGVSVTRPGRLAVSYPNYLDLREDNGAFTDLAASRWRRLSLAGSGGVEQVSGEIVTPNYFEVLGLAAARGRLFRPREGNDPVVVLSHGFWQSRFGADPEIVGKPLMIDGHSFTVVGVAPERFTGLVLSRHPRIWIPMTARHQLMTERELAFFELRHGLALEVAGRLAPGISPARARAAMERRMQSLAETYPAANEGLGVGIVPLTAAFLPGDVRDHFVLAGRLLTSVAAVVLLVTCANVANLLLAGALGRRREIAVRLSLGAGRRHLVRQFLSEGLVLSLAGGAAGLGLAAAGREILWALRPPFLSDTLDLGFHLPVLAFTLGLSLATGLLVALAPIRATFRLDLVDELKEGAGADLAGAPRRFGFGNVPVVVQVTFTLTLLVGASFFLDSLRRLREIDPGFEARDLFLVHLSLGSRNHTAATGQAFYGQVVERLESLSRVERASLSSHVMLGPPGPQETVKAEGREDREDQGGRPIPVTRVGVGYFGTVGTPLVRGRSFTPADRGSPRVAVVNEAMERWLWPEEGAVGRRLRVGSSESPAEVVGVVGDVKYGSLYEPPRPQVYLPALEQYSPGAFLFVRTVGDPRPWAEAVRREIHALDPELPVSEAVMAQKLLDDALWAARTLAGLLTVFGSLALVLSAVGIYGVLAYSVSRRRREIGIRVACGARRADVLGLLVGRGMTAVGAGLILGLAVAAVLSPYASSLLFDVRPADPAPYAVAVLMMTAVALAAILLPSWRVARAEPSAALRDE